MSVQPSGSLSLAARVLAASMLATLLLPAVAADNVVNDVAANGGDTVEAGATTSISYRIVSTGGDGLTGCNALSPTPATVTILAPANVTASPTQLVFSSCGTWQEVEFSSSQPGLYTIAASVQDSGPGTYQVTSARFVLNVTAPPEPADETPPSISAEVSHGPAGTGWYDAATGPPTITFLCSDEGSGIAFCSPPVILGEGANQTVLGLAADEAGNNATVLAGPFHVDTVAPSISANATPDAAGTGWHNIATGAPTVSFLCSDGGSGLASCTPPATLGDGADQTVLGEAIDVAGNNASALAGPFDVDLTAPSISANATPDAAGSGWHNNATGPPTVSFACSDEGSGLASCSPPSTLGDGADQTVLGEAVDIAGNNATALAGPFDVDTGLPSIVANATSDPAGSGWHNIATGAPTVSFLCSDGGSGIASCTPPATLGEGANQTVPGTAVDEAGNSASALAGPFHVDLTAPALVLPADLVVLATAVGGGPASFNVSATDNLDAAPDVVCSAASGDQFPLGPTVVECVATDEAGNSASGNFTVTLRYNVQGFFQPVKENRLNVVKAGSTVPLKFAIRTPGGGFIGDLAAVAAFTVEAIPCAPLLSNPIAFTTTGGTALRYDATANQFIQNWQAPKAKGCVEVSVEFADGTVLSAPFQLK